MKAVRPLLSGLSLMALAACSESETDVRDTLGAWLALGETRHFSAGLNCAAGVFALRDERLRGDLPVARSAAEALGLSRFERPFVLEFPGMSISAMSEVLQEIDFRLGARVLNAGVGARDCLPDTYKDDYFEALSGRGIAAIFDPNSESLTIIDAGLGRAWFSRGASR